MTTPRWHSTLGLRELPFDKDLPDDDLWLPKSRAALVEDVVEAVHERGHILLTGEPGVGKTCALRAVRRRLPEAGFRLTYCHNATLGRRDFYRQLCLALGLAPKATAAAVFFAITSHIEQLGRDRIHPIFLLDEAHLLHQDVLEHLHVLANYEWDSRPLLSIVLVGLPEISGKLALSKNRSLWSRIHTRLNLGEALPEDTVEYVEHRLRRVAAPANLFSSDALALLHEATHGRLRDIDRLASAALKRAARKKLKHIDRELFEAVLEAERRPDLD